jgi:hypothetical protein
MSLFDHLEQIEIGIAGRKRQVLMGRTVKMQAAAAVIDQDNGGIEMLQKHILVQVREFERRLFFDSGLKSGREPGSRRETRYRRGDGPLS